MCMYVDMCAAVFTFVCMNAWVYARLCTCARTWICVHVYRCVHVCVHVLWAPLPTSAPPLSPTAPATPPPEATLPLPGGPAFSSSWLFPRVLREAGCPAPPAPLFLHCHPASPAAGPGNRRALPLTVSDLDQVPRPLRLCPHPRRETAAPWPVGDGGSGSGGKGSGCLQQGDTLGRAGCGRVCDGTHV